MTELTDHEITALRKFVKDVEIAGNGDITKGAQALGSVLFAVRDAGSGDVTEGAKMLREAMIARRNAGAFYRFVIIVGGALLAALATGKTVIENVSWLLGLKFGGK